MPRADASFSRRACKSVSIRIFNSVNVFTETPNKRRAQKVATAQKVLLAARDAFERDGFEGASVRGIARDAGVAVGTVLKHYGDKRQLLFAALHEALDEALDVAANADSSRGNVFDQLLGSAESVFEVYRARPRLGRTLLRVALFADGSWGVRFVQQTGRAHGLVAVVVRDAVARGELPPETDAEELGLAFLSFFYFALVSWAQCAPLPFGPLGLIERLLVGRLGMTPTRTRRSAPSLALPETTPSSGRTTHTKRGGPTPRPAKAKNAKAKNAKAKNTKAKPAKAKNTKAKPAKAKTRGGREEGGLR